MTDILIIQVGLLMAARTTVSDHHSVFYRSPLLTAVVTSLIARLSEKLLRFHPFTGNAIAGTNNARTYFHSAICGMLAWGYPVFYFEAFDEPWKPASVGDNGAAADETHWGAMTAARGEKYSLRC